jgi:single-stranded-DNA-specific exonuclease
VQEIVRPTVLIALSGEHGRGSARSIPALHLYETLQACASHLERFGGHRAAAGLEIRAAHVDAFRAAFQDAARLRLTEDDLRPELALDAELAPGAAAGELWRFVRHMGPFGIGNDAPLFLTRGAAVLPPVEVVGERHLRMRLGDASAWIPAIAFQAAEAASWVRPGARVDAVYRLQERRAPEPGPEAVLVDLRAAGS